MNVISVDSAARASSWEGAVDGVTLPMLGLVFADSSAIDRGLALIVLVRAVAAKEAGKAGLGPQLEIGEKKGEVGLL